MGCGGVKTRESPRSHSRELAERPGKLPALVLEAFARMYGIPLRNPNPRTKPKPKAVNRGKGLFEGAERVETCEERGTVTGEALQREAVGQDESVSPLPAPPQALASSSSSSPQTPAAFQPPAYLDEAAQLEALQRAAQERQAAEDQLIVQSRLIDQQKTQAEAIMSKYEAEPS